MKNSKMIQFHGNMEPAFRQDCRTGIKKSKGNLKKSQGKRNESDRKKQLTDFKGDLHNEKEFEQHFRTGKEKVMKILVSACLLGVCCRYNGKGGAESGNKGTSWKASADPGMSGDPGRTFYTQNAGRETGVRVMTRDGRDVTAAYEKGAEETLKLAELFGCRHAILKERSPSCGNGVIYDGTFQGKRIPGDGKTTELLKKHGIQVAGESDFMTREAFL